MNRSRCSVTVVMMVVASACGGGGQASDPRCTSLCQYEGPGAKTYGGYCNEASATLCADTCTARIKGVNTVCQSCLLENASYHAPSVGGGQPDMCVNSQCTVSQGGVSCQYTSGDTSQRTACYEKVYPLKAVDCTVDYRPVTECASVCSPTP